MKVSDNETLWVKIGNIKDISTMGRDVVIIGRDCFLQFLNLNTGEVTQQLTLNNHKINGDGLKCFKGHSYLHIFAYCENCQQPNIYVKSYPDFQIICKFTGVREGYKSLAFSDCSFLFALGEMPHYKVTVWNWRSTEKFAESSNELLYENQKITCSNGRPMYLAQYGVGSNKLFIWDVFIVCKSTIFTKHEVSMGKYKPAPFEDIVWSMENVALYIIDSKGCIYTVDRDFCLELIVDVSEAGICGNITPSICWYLHGLTVSGPNQEIRHYKKLSAAWISDFQYPTPEAISGIISRKSEKCVGRTVNSDIISFGATENSLTYLKKNESNFSTICTVNPIGKFMVAIRNEVNILLFNMETGEVVSSLILDNRILCIADHPSYPFVAVAQENGCIQLISFHNETKPASLVQMYLTETPLTTVKFFEEGHLFVTGNRDCGEFFILKGLPGTQIEVIINIQVGRQVVDYMMVASQNMIRFFGILSIKDKLFAGNKIIRYCIVDKVIVKVKEFEFKNQETLYRRIYPTKGQNKDSTFYLIPLHTRYFEVAEIKQGNPKITITETIKTGHQVRRFLMRLSTKYALTWGYDGFTFIRSLDFRETKGMVLCNHRYYQGVAKAISNHDATIIVTLGYSGVLAAVRLPYKTDNQEELAKLCSLVNSPKYRLIFKKPTLGIAIENRFEGMNWKEIQRLKIIEEEERQCAKELSKILNEFQDIQNILINLVNQNVDGPENQKLDMLEFYLDIPSYHKRQQKNKEDCKELDTYLKCLILAQDKVSAYIIKNYYEPMVVQWQNILGIHSAVKATNYSLLPENHSQIKRFRWIEEQRKIERYLSSQDNFEPWLAMTKQELQELKIKRPMAPKQKYTDLEAPLKLQEKIDITDLGGTLESKIAIDGSVSQLYIPVSSTHYSQRQLNSFYQCELQQTVAEHEIIQLKYNYNKCFHNIRALKEREMNNIKEKNARLRHIISEFNYFSDEITLDVVDPEWEAIENVETDILRVSNIEVPVRPYISPSEQAILDAKAAEVERLQLLQIADDFRERTLMAMMNGVLEVRWEDELKKEIIKPKCILEKNSSEFNEEDLGKMRAYEDKVAQLKADREKYTNLLEMEFITLSTGLRDTIRKFNQKLHDCTTYKLYIDSGINHENLIINKQLHIQNQRIQIQKKEREILQMIKDYELYMGENQKIIIQVQEALVECKNTMDMMQLKEKQLEKAYRRDFQDMSPIVQEQSYKLYRKRPKANFRIISTATVLNELAKGVLTNEITYTMTQECLDYLKALEAIDVFAGLPSTIDETTWQLICKHRRLHIELEMRLRAIQVQIFEGEATISTFQKRVVTKKEKIVLLNTQLEETRKDRLKIIHNKQIQLVVRRGLVEIPMKGEFFTDFTDAILLPKAEIENVNKLIVAAGQLKLKTIEKNLKFRRIIMATEWEHMRLRMKIDDFIEQKRDIENVKFTKEMQLYLKNKGLGRKQQVESFEMEIERLTVMYETRIKERKNKVKKIRTQLEVFKENNANLDKVINEINIDVYHYRIEKDFDVEEREQEILEARMSGMFHRNQLIHDIQKNHNDILVLQAELELLRLRTFPTFKYKVLKE
ncbi:cilia- and flagella-associated protein 43 isoform X2 [Euwallacea fornicatus]|uniref:cilia- and flagella-associated protein 43 isoform X2 n=1 Tax=Euwallacea fornicatus TaxID=995702 RepID=UPI00338F0F4F